ncbi:MAG: glucosaminidase domain-containing protein [Phaeodactylibacter sp.]|nr:glucosaminidase domain-containing protein [Phaeodactylibacter sp.]MCB9272601.1 glucosaminidase domain-containing protein [Lewinellaceae bacterium]
MPERYLPVQAIARKAGQQISHGLQKYWLKMALLGAAAYLVYRKDLAIDLQLSNIPAAAIQLIGPAEQSLAAEAYPANTSLLEPQRPAARPAAAKPRPAAYEKPANVSNLANSYSNLTNANKGLPDVETEALKVEKRRKQLKYVRRFYKVAQTEMEKFGIPASITLAQGLLESNVGESKLATHNNNHFGIKCFSRTCAKGHCTNFTDDSHKDFFRKYKSAWESYRAHSLLLQRNTRYKHLFKLEHDDFRNWAKGLKSAGYATDKQYAEKLINLIEDLGLHEYDE